MSTLTYALLGILAEGPQTGYGLLKHFRGSLNYAWPASHSQIYPELARLHEQGLIRQTAEGPRGSKTYEITEGGLAAVRTWLRETEPNRSVRSEPLLRIFLLWLLEPEETANYLRGELEHLRGLLAELDAIEEDRPDTPTARQRSYGVALECGLRETQARIEWAEWAVREVSHPAAER
jgi:PadR family transcriptional regulator, regulatory protein AphA